jgi:hypothetical protein
MSYDLERFVATNPATERSQLGWIASQVARSRQRGHVLTMRQIRRDAEEAIAREGEALIGQLAELERDARAVTETKFRLERARKESLIIAGEDPDLQSKFLLLDDDFVQRRRLKLMEDC